MRTFYKVLLGALFGLALIGGGASNVYPQARVSSVEIQTAATATGRGDVHQPVCTDRTFQAYGATSAGAGAATIIIYGSDIAVPVQSTEADWVVLGTITLTLGTTRTGDGFASQARWRHVRSRVSAISGTNASVTVLLGC